MKVPTYAKYLNRKILVNSNNQISYVTPPFQPYSYIYNENSSLKITLLSNMKSIPVSIKEFEDKKESLLFGEGYYNIDSLDQILIDKKEFFITDNNDYKVMILDIEVLTKKNTPFPKPEHNQIIGIGLSFIEHVESSDPLISRFILIDKDNELRLFKHFKNLVLKYKPDIIVGYNLKYFDIPYIVKRFELSNLSCKFLSRTEDVRIFGKFKKTISISGVTVFDILDSVKGDFALRGIKNKSMKTVARHFKFQNLDIVELDESKMSNLETVPEDELFQYLRSDIKITERLFKHYFPIKKSIAEILYLPLNLVLDNPPGYLPTIIQARILTATNIIGDIPNNMRYSNLRYTGGEVFFNNIIGLYKNICKLDFVSMYPTIIMQFNLSPETVFFIKEEELSKFRTWEDNEANYYSLPEEVLKKNIVIKVLKKEGLLVKEMIRLFNYRKKLKEDYLNATENKDALYSIQYALKVLINSVYGYNASEDALWGNFYVGLAITSIGRVAIKTVAEIEKDSVIEIDTDGVFFSKEVDEKEIESKLNKIFNKTFEVEKDSYKKGWFYKAKNYILIDKKDKLTIKGNSLKSSRICPLIDKARNIIIKKFLIDEEIITHNNKVNLTKQIFNMIHTSPLEDFLFSSKAERILEEYSGNCIQKKLLLKYKELNKEINRGEAMYFAVNKINKKQSFIVKEEFKSIKQIDIQYYKTALENLLNIFNLKNAEQVPLTQYLQSPTQNPSNAVNV